MTNSSSASTKVPIVYDASSKSKKGHLSLNESFHRGPVNLENLCGLLMRFRTKRIALTADTEKAFLQVGLNEADRDVTRFLWVKDIKKPVVDTNLQVYRFTRIPFGIISSPSLLGSTVKRHLKSIGTPITEKAVHDIHVDNLISGVNTMDNAIQFYKEIKQSFKEASMNMRDWGSNSTEFLKTVPADDRNHQVISKVLGILWDKKQNKLMIRSPNHKV